MLPAVPGDAVLDVALDGADVLRAETPFVEAAQIRPVGLAGMDAPDVLGKQAQKGAVPEQGAVGFIERAHRDVQTIERRGDRPEQSLRINHRAIVSDHPVLAPAPHCAAQGC